MAGSTIIQLVLRTRDDMSKGLSSAAAKITALIAAFAGASAIKETFSQLPACASACERGCWRGDFWDCRGYLAVPVGG